MDVLTMSGFITCNASTTNSSSPAGRAYADKALIAEQVKRIVQLEISCDRNYVEGMKTGWNYCDAGNSDVI
jgi:hypothetical protein